MDKSSRLAQAAVKLQAATKAQDWDGIAALQVSLPALLRECAGTGMSNAEKAALARLRSEHQAASEACAAELARLGHLLQDMRDHKDGWLAYATGSEQEEGQT